MIINTDPKISLVIKSSSNDTINSNEKEKFNKLIKESALGLFKNYKKVSSNKINSATEEFILSLSKSLDGKSFTLFVKYLGELKTNVLEQPNHKLSPDSFLIFLDKMKNITHSESLNDIIVKKMSLINLDQLDSKTLLNIYQKNAIDSKFEQNLRMDEIRQFANEVIPKPRFIFDKYKTSLTNTLTSSDEEQAIEISKQKGVGGEIDQQKNQHTQKQQGEDYFSFFSSHESIILKPESNFKNENFDSKSGFKKTNHIFFKNLPLILEKYQGNQKEIKMITYNDIYQAKNKEDIYQILLNEFASEELLGHVEKRSGQLKNFFYINYHQANIANSFKQSTMPSKVDELEQFEYQISGNKSKQRKAQGSSVQLNEETVKFEDLISIATQEFLNAESMEDEKLKSKKSQKNKNVNKTSNQAARKLSEDRLNLHEKEKLGLNKPVMRQGFIVFSNYHDKLKFINTAMFLFGLKLYNQERHIEFLDADFCNTIAIESQSFEGKSLGECCSLLNQYMIMSGFQEDILVVGKLKGLGNDFDLSKMIVRDNYKISVRLNNFEQALQVFKIFSKLDEKSRDIFFKVQFENPYPNYYDGMLSTYFESCIKEKFEGLTTINEIQSNYVKKQLDELKQNNSKQLQIINKSVLEQYRTLTDGVLPLKREERELYEQLDIKKGTIQTLLQLFTQLIMLYRYFKVISNGSYLAYYNQKPTSKQFDLKPNGVFEIGKLTNIQIKDQKQQTFIRQNIYSFYFDFNDRNFEMFTKTKEEAGSWVTCLKFLADQKSREQETATSSRSLSYFSSLQNNLQLQEQVSTKEGGEQQEEKRKSKSRTRTKAHKFTNIDAKAFASVAIQNPQLVLNKDQTQLSEKALITKGIWNYLKTVKEKTLKSRIQYGFLKKRSKGKIKYFSISKTFQNQEKFLNDTEILSESVLPPLLEFDVIYYFRMDTLDDASGPAGDIKTINILKVEIKNMNKSKEEGHAFIIDTGKKLFHLNTEHRFELERWVEAVEISMQTAKERQLSITGACKNISQIVTLFDTNEDILRQQIEDMYDKKIPKTKKDWEDVESLLSTCTDLSDDMITPYETLSLVDWTYRYNRDLKKFGVVDDAVENGYLQLCTSYAKKTHGQIMPLEKENKQIEEDRSGFLYTNAPYDIVKIFSESFQIVVVKKIKELILKTLKMFQSDQKLQHDFLIAQCNNCFIYFELMEDLLQQVSDTCTDDEIESHFSQRQIQSVFLKIQSVLLNQMTNAIFKIRLDLLYTKNFLDQDMEVILNESFRFFEDYSSKMSRSTSRQAWACFLERTVLCYIQCMLNSSKKIRQKSSEEAIAKIKEDYEKIERRFGEFMTTRSMKSGIEVLDDLVSFFESSPAFISVACEKLRKTHGPTFNISTVKAILNLRTDLVKDERIQAIKICEEILAAFKNTDYDNPNKRGIFSNLDISQAEMIVDKENNYIDSNDPNMNQNDNANDAPDIDLEDFLKQGGIDLDQIDGEEQKQKDLAEQEEKKEEQDKPYNIDPDDRMTGWLTKSSIKMEKEGEEDILGFMISGIGNSLKMGLKLFTETIQIKQKKQFFAIKNGTLYWYSHERARQAENQIDIKISKAVEINKNDPKEFYILFKKKCYRMQCDHEQEALKWVNSLKQVRDQDNDYLNINRYEKLKIYQKITGKSLYKDYDQLLEIYENQVHQIIEKKLQEYLQKKNKWKSVESSINSQAKSGLKKQQKDQKNQKQEQESSVIFKQEEENFVKQLPETIDLMNKLNPNAIDLFQAAFGQEDAVYASNICKKIQQKAIKRAMSKSFFKEDFDFGKDINVTRQSEVSNNDYSDSRTKSTDGRRTITQELNQDKDDLDQSDESDWGLEENNSTQQTDKVKGIMKQDMQGMSLRRLDIDPNELIRDHPLQSPMGSSQVPSCFSCFSIRGNRKK
ncbi:ph domain containing protein [Stylonychia lemnae]|uniref:Ph domain containing protein n=1 Tax=Stylonychia lemnae TaxID=5949 RepID=A0A077ZP18_STYLE|nr:ph domain containing protein [Stylonychia lemnae]|eukprot:CDW71658.1 ph domain containing protein [Stylonychia lemnae]